MNKKTSLFSLSLVALLAFNQCHNNVAAKQNTEAKPNVNPPLAPMNTTLNNGQNTIKFSSIAGNERGFYLSTEQYNKALPNRLVLVFPGTNWKGAQMKKLLNKNWYGQMTNAMGVLEKGPQLEEQMQNTIFVYPDPKWRNFGSWGASLGGFLMGPNGGNGVGMEDIEFIKGLLDLLMANFNIDKNKVFATGHSWGGDMAAVCGVFLPGKFRAIMPVAANRPYWFDASVAAIPTADKVGNMAVWTLFGKEDSHFTWQVNKQGAFGYMQNNFWKKYYGVTKDSTMVKGYIDGETYEYGNGTTPKLRLTIYSPAKKGYNGHQPNDHYTKMAADWFNSF